MSTEERLELNKRICIAAAFMLGLMAAAVILLNGWFASAKTNENGSNNEALETIAASQMTYATIMTSQIAPEPRFISQKEPFLTEVTHPCFAGDDEGFKHGTIERGHCLVCGELVEPRYGFTEDEIYLLTQLLCGSKNISGDGEYDFDWTVQNEREPNQYQISLVLDVVMNRVLAENAYADNVYDVVVGHKGAFSVFPKNLKTTPEPLAIEVVREWCEAFDAWDPEAQVIPEDHFWFSSAGGNTNRSRSYWRR